MTASPNPIRRLYGGPALSRRCPCPLCLAYAWPPRGGRVSSALAWLRGDYARGDDDQAAALDDRTAGR